jgi:predicted porin
MRKTQVALAALALVASTAALADGVTVYGTLDASMVSSNNNGGTNFSGPGQWSASVIGFRGTTDLDNGIKATFNLEGGISSANGGNNNGGTTNLFNRAANVGLSGGFGTVTAGVQVSPFIVSSASSLALAGNNFLVPAVVNAGTVDASGVAASAVSTGGFFISNAITYANSFGPVSFSIMSASKGTNAAGNAFQDDNQYMGGNVSYADGGLFLTAAMADRKSTYRSTMVGASYTMDQMKFAGQVHDYAAGTAPGIANDRKTYILSASYAISGSTTVGVNYVNTDVATTTTDPKLTNLSMTHTLGKSTMIYAFVGNGKGGSAVSYGAAVPSGTTATSAYGIGINHNF